MNSLRRIHWPNARLIQPTLKESRRSALHLARLAPHSLSRDINCRACFCQCQCSRQCSGRACALTQSRRFVSRQSAAQPVPQVLQPAASVDRDVVEANGKLSRRDVVEAAGRAAGPAGNRAADAPSFNDPQLFTNFNIFQCILSILII